MGNYNPYLKKLRPVCSQKKIKLIKLGTANSFPLYQIILNPSASKTVVFSAGIHGNEIAGPLAVIQFLKQFNQKKWSGLKIVIFPVANPAGFDNNDRLNHLRIDLNRQFCKRNLKNENKILFNSLKKVFFFHAIHEDITVSSFYLYNFENKKEKIYRDIISIAKRYFPINKSSRIYKESAVNGLIRNQKDGSFEDRMFRDKTPYSMCTETPGLQPLQKRVLLNVKIMNNVLDFAKKRNLLEMFKNKK